MPLARYRLPLFKVVSIHLSEVLHACLDPVSGHQIQLLSAGQQTDSPHFPSVQHTHLLNPVQPVLLWIDGSPNTFITYLIIVKCSDSNLTVRQNVDGPVLILHLYSLLQMHNGMFFSLEYLGMSSKVKVKLLCVIFILPQQQCLHLSCACL